MNVKYAQITPETRSSSKIEFLIQGAAPTNFTINHYIEKAIVKTETLPAANFGDNRFGFYTQAAGDIEVLINSNPEERYLFEFDSTEVPNDTPFLYTEYDGEELTIYSPYIDEDLIYLQFFDEDNKELYIDKGSNPYLYTTGPVRYNNIVVRKIHIYPGYLLYRIKETFTGDDWSFDEFYWYQVSDLGKIYIRMKVPQSPFTSTIVKKIQSDKMYNKTYGEMFQV